MIQWLADQCQQYLLAEKWLLAQDLRIAQQWKDRINLHGCSTVNLHAKTFATATVSLAARLLAQRRLTFASQSTVGLIVRSVFCRLSDAGELAYFHRVQSIDGICELLASSLRDLRMAKVDPDSIKESAFESAEKAGDIRLLYAAYCTTLEEQRMADEAACLALCREGVQDGSIELPSDLRIVMPETWRWSRAEQQWLDTLDARESLCRCQDHDPFSVASERLPDRIAVNRKGFAFFAGLGEVNEIRGVFERIVSSQHGGPHPLDDVEILHTDAQQYVPLVLEQVAGWLPDDGSDSDKPSDLDALPVTFADGIACVYSRPGRALRGWLRWARHEFVQSRAVQLVREGLLVRPPDAEKIGYSRLANSLRRVPIGFQSDRYLSKIRESIQSAEENRKTYLLRGDPDSAASGSDTPQRDFGLPTLRAMLSMVEPLVDLAPANSDDAVAMLSKAREFLLRCARVDNKLDRYSRARLVDDIDTMLATLGNVPDANLNVLPWLEELPIRSRILASGPRPGRVHVHALARWV